jgi:Fe-S oxidoreductase
MLDNYMETLENCRFCLMCRHVEPVGLVTDLETLTPHGIALIATSQARGLIDWNKETVGVVYSEPDGGNSRAHCVFNQPHPAAVAAVRAGLVEQNLAPAAVYETGKALAEWGTPYAAHKAEAATGQGEVALFVGDEAHYLWPDALPAALKLLEKVGIEPVLIGSGRNNGLLASSLGFPQTAASLIQTTLAELEASGAKKLLVLSPGDYFTFNQAAPERLGIQLPSSIELQELVTFLAEKLAAGDLSFASVGENPPYAYIDPTHAVRHPGRHAAARQLTSATMVEEPLELFFNRENAHPVGSTHLQFSKPDLAEKLTLARLDDARDSGAEVLISEDPGTLYQLSKYADSYGLGVVGLYEILAQNLS